MNRLCVFFLTVFLLSIQLQVRAQARRYFVRFTDKQGTPYSLSDPSQFLSQRAVERRNQYRIPFHTSDLPVTPSYVAQVRSVPNIRVHYATKWFNGVVVSFASESDEGPGLAAIDAMAFVVSTDRVRRIGRSVIWPDSTAKKRSATNAGAATSYDYGEALNQAQQLDLVCLHEQGYRGQGMVIAVMDAGFSSVPVTDVFDSLRLGGRLLGGRDFVSGGTNPYVGGDHGTMVLSCMAAIKSGTSIGTAPLASYWLIRTEEGFSETVSEEYNWIRAAEFADSVGADILTTSLGYTTFDDSSQDHTYQNLNGRTAPMSIAATMAARKGIFVLNAAGNEGDKQWHFISVPGDADSICTVGAVNSAGVKAAFSSVGPTADGRIKPDLMAQGEGAYVCSGNVCFPANGTSFSTPVLAGGVACFWQANRKLNNIEVLSYLRQNASAADSANNNYGWGVPRLCKVSEPTSMHFDVYAGPGTMRVKLSPANYKQLEIRVTDLLGKELFRSVVPGIHYDITLLTPSLSAGVYIVYVTSPYGEEFQKVLKLDL